MTREEFFNKLDAGAKWNVGVSIARTNPLPLDANEIFRSVTDMETYIATNLLAYPGQLVVVLGETETAAYLVKTVGGNGKGYSKLAATSGSGDVNAQLEALSTRLTTIENRFTETGVAKEAVKAQQDGSGKIISDTYATKAELTTAITGSVQYLDAVATDNAVSALKPNSKGDFARASGNFTLSAANSSTGVAISVHAGDLLICASIGTPNTWTVSHGGEEGVVSISNGTGIAVNNTNPASPVISLTSDYVNEIAKITNKVDKENGKGLSTEDFTTTLKTKLEGISEGATNVTVDSELTSTGTNPVQGKAIYSTINTLEGKVDNKVDKVDGKELSSNDYTDDEKTKLAGLKNYTLPIATTSALGGIKVGYDGTTEKTYAVKLDTNGNAYVKVPWVNSTYDDLNIAAGVADGVGNAATTNGNTFLKFCNTDTVLSQIKIIGSGATTVTSSADGIVTINSTDTKYTLPTAKLNTLGGIKLKHSAITTEAAINEETATADRFYAINVDKNGYAFVNVPWTDTKYTLPTATATVLGGVKIGSGITITNGVISLTDKSKYDGYETNKLDKSALTVSATAGVTLNGTTYKYTLSKATDEVLGGIKIGYTTSDRNFAVQLDPNGKAYVTVPASAEYSLPMATENTLGGIKAKQSDGANDIQYITNKKSYGVMVNALGHAWVGIPDTISTDKITQGTNTLIINGGGANW